MFRIKKMLAVVFTQLPASLLAASLAFTEKMQPGGSKEKKTKQKDEIIKAKHLQDTFLNKIQTKCCSTVPNEVICTITNPNPILNSVSKRPFVEARLRL